MGGSQASHARLAEIERVGGIGTWTWDPRGGLWWSAEMRRLHGIAPDQLPVNADYSTRLVHPDHREDVQESWRRMLRDGVPWDLEYRIVRPDGTQRWLAARALPDGVGDELRQVVGIVRDVTEDHEAEDRRRRAHEDLAAHQAILQQIVRGQPLGVTLDTMCRDIERRFPHTYCSVMLVDEDLGVLRDGAAPSLPAGARAALDGLPIGEGEGACGTAAHRGEAVVVEDTLVDPLAKGYQDIVGTYDLRAIWSHPLKNAAGEALGTFALYRNVPHVPDRDETSVVRAAADVVALAIERERTEQQLVRSAQIDSLTGLINRQQFLQKLVGRLRHGSTRTAVMFLDLDRFKWINDSFGHPTGDRILAELGHRFQKAFSGQQTVARFGGDEFTVLLEDATDDRIADAARHVAEVLTEPFHVDRGEFVLTVSIGIAIDDGLADAEGLVRDADAAMYAAKERGRARWVVFDQQLRERALERVDLEAQLRRGIAEGEFTVHYQPSLMLETGEWGGAEALARWYRDGVVVANPDRFIPLAEETGQIVELGMLLLEQVIEQTAAWHAAGRSTVVSVNLAVQQLTDPNLVERLGEMLQRHGLPPQLLVVEVTESAVMRHFDQAREALEQLRRMGLHLVIDDFGTGYSSIARMRDLPVVAVKIDRSFTKDLGVTPQADEVMAAVVGLAHAFGLQTVVEGVETLDALERLRTMGCEVAQGYLLGRPQTAEQLEATLSAPPPC